MWQIRHERQQDSINILERHKALDKHSHFYRFVGIKINFRNKVIDKSKEK